MRIRLWNAAQPGGQARVRHRLKFYRHDAAQMVKQGRLPWTSRAASQHVASLIRRGYATQTRPGEYGRVRLVQLTGAGRADRRGPRCPARRHRDRRIEAELAERLGRDALDAWRQVTDALIDTYLAEAPAMVQVVARMSASPE
jgi:DNA-binding MarR family transcriptional regulator